MNTAASNNLTVSKEMDLNMVYTPSKHPEQRPGV